MTLKEYKENIQNEDFYSEISHNLVSNVFRIRFKHFTLEIIELQWYYISIWIGEFNLTYSGQLENKKFLTKKSLKKYIEKNNIKLKPVGDVTLTRIKDLGFSKYLYD